ncbi:MAG: gliding motility-associated C-terminal domain-containing protein [Bacteroidota bacterium]
MTLQWQKSTNGGSTWSDISSATSSTFDETSTIAVTTSYRRKVTDGSAAVEYSNTLTITVNSKPDISLSTGNVGCFGGNNGSINTTISSGTSPFTYGWTASSFTASTKDISSLTAKTYTLIVTDNNSCKDTASSTVTEPAAALSLSNSSQTNVLCFGNTTGAVTVSASGGTSPYEYKIGSGSYSSSATFSTLAAGSYTITAKDANGCTQTLSVTITQPSAAISVTAVASTNISCNAGTDGTITITATGGSTKKYSIDNGSTFQSSNVFTGLAAGTYTIVVSDNNNCSGSFASGVSASVTLTQPNAISVTAVAFINPSCKTANDGSITITANGGNTLSYSIDNGATYQSSNIFSGLGIGSYTVKVRDSKSCSVSYGSVNTTITLSNGDITKPNVLTKNYDAYLNNSGAITISYSNVNNGSTDNCEINAIYLDDSTFDCTNIGANTVTLTVTDIAGNTDTKTATVTVYDTISPMPKAKNLVVYLDATGHVNITAAQANNASTDNCSIKSLSLSKSNFSCADTGVNNSIKFTATDYSNNTAYTFFNVRVYDTISPMPKAKNLVVYLDATGNVSITAAQANNASTDNCSIKTLSLSKSNFSCADTGVNNSIKFTATDYSNNTAYTFFNVRVYDTISPMPKAKNLVVYLDATGNVSITAAQANNASTDNCSIKTLSLSKSNFSCADTGVNTGIIFTAIDYSNNQSYTTFNVTVWDTIKPTIVVKTAVVYLDTAAKAKLTRAIFTVSTNDNCGVIDTTLSRYEVTLADTGWTDIDVWVTDKNKNTTGPIRTKVLVLIADSDNDSIPDYIEGSKDFDGDGVFDFADMDSDNDGILDVVENEGKDSLIDWDVDGKPNYKDLDTDNDGIDDVIEVSGSDSDFDGIAGTGAATVDSNGVPTIASGGYKEIFTDSDSQPDYKDLDADDDSILDSIEKGSTNNPVDTDGDGTGDWRDLDTDNDGIADKTETDVDTDGDGTGDWRDLDTDNDGIADKTETDVDTDGDGTGDWRDLDSDNDTIIDKTETDIDTDGDGTGDWRDLDTDNDGIADKTETDVDTDGDGTGDWRDLDTDNDGIADKTETDVDTDGDGTGDWRDLDTDNDGIADKTETDVDTDGDGTGDWRDLDSDNDGISDKIETDIDTDGDGLGDWRDLDSDNDNISDKIETDIDTDGDGKGDWRDIDSDNDGIIDKIESDIDTDGDGQGDWRDLDSDNDGLLDTKEAGLDPNNPLDTDGDGIYDFRELDSDNDELPDNEEGLSDSKIPNIWIPEGISPNGDGANDILYIKGLANFKNASVTIFNRWGQVVYESGIGYNNANGFDGRYRGNGITINNDGPLPENVYFLVFKSNDASGIIIKQNIYIKAN